MITDNDQQIQKSVLDSLPITAEILKELGWKYVSSSSANYGHGWCIHWTIWEKDRHCIELSQSRGCLLKKSRFACTGQLIESVRELNKYS